MQIITPWRLKWYPVAALLAIVVAFLICMFSGEGVQILSGELGGDFPAFYGAGRIVLDGNVDQLYNVEQQLAEQRGLHEISGKYLCFAYPPFVALPYAALAVFPYRIAYVINVLLMLSALIIILKILFKKYDISSQYYLLAFTLALSFFPIFKALFGGQNTLLTLLLLCLYWVYADRKKEIQAGVFLGLMLFKPQFALPLIGLMLLSKRWVVVLSSLLTGLLLYLLCIYMLGTGWLFEWFEFALWFSKIDAEVNSINAVSWLGFSETLFGPENTNVRFWGLFASVAHSLLLSFYWIKRYGSESGIINLMPITCLSLILIPSHTMYYDSGIMLIAVFSLAVFFEKYRLQIITIVWLCGFTQILAPYLGFSPIFFVVIVCLIAVSVIPFYNNKTHDIPLVR